MRESEAAAMVGVLAAYFPATPRMSEESVRLFAAEFLPYSVEVGQAVVREIGRTARFFPSLADVINALVAEDRYRNPRPRPELEMGTGPTYAEWLAANPEMRRLVAQIGGEE